MKNFTGLSWEKTVFERFKKAGKDGLTDSELENLTGGSHETVSGRRNDLVRKGVVVWNGKRRKTMSGKKAKVWVLAIYADSSCPAPAPRRPSRKDIIIAETAISRAVAGNEQSSQLVALLIWLRSIGSGETR